MRHMSKTSHTRTAAGALALAIALATDLRPMAARAALVRSGATEGLETARDTCLTLLDSAP